LPFRLALRRGLPDSTSVPGVHEVSVLPAVSMIETTLRLSRLLRAAGSSGQSVDPPTTWFDIRPYTI
jgi:hypothetical protein